MSSPVNSAEVSTYGGAKSRFSSIVSQLQPAAILFFHPIPFSPKHNSQASDSTSLYYFALPCFITILFLPPSLTLSAFIFAALAACVSFRFPRRSTNSGARFQCEPSLSEAIRFLRKSLGMGWSQISLRGMSWLSMRGWCCSRAEIAYWAGFPGPPASIFISISTHRMHKVRKFYFISHSLSFII